jgi:hypothetical protein
MKSINKQIEIIVDDMIKSIAFPVIVEITNVYPNDKRVDCVCDEYGEIKYVESVLNHTVGDKSVLVFSENDLTKKIII